MKFQTKAKKGKITMKKYLAVTLCALSAAAVVTACAAGDRNDSNTKKVLPLPPAKLRRLRARLKAAMKVRAAKKFHQSAKNRRKSAMIRQRSAMSLHAATTQTML